MLPTDLSELRPPRRIAAFSGAAAIGAVVAMTVRFGWQGLLCSLVLLIATAVFSFIFTLELVDEVGNKELEEWSQSAKR